ncbi:Thaumatin-like protein [Aphelenchoides bicaudatus]|nr:Thaumatin-like protein [Aphelenchoides bicaudatus]
MFFILVALFAVANADTTITLVNKCPHPIWPALWGNPQPSTKGFKLDAGKSIPIRIPTHWDAGRIWARTECTGSDGSLTCKTGDCGNKLQCIHTGEKPATLAEFTMNGAGGQVFYDISYVDGSNVPMTIKPVANTFKKESGQYNCGTAGQCSKDLRQAADPSILFKVNGKTLGTWAACSPITNNNPQYCCSGAHDKPETCPKSAIPNKFYGALKKVCPQSYFYAYDDRLSTWTCRPSSGRTAPDFVVTFCEVTGLQG